MILKREFIAEIGINYAYGESRKGFLKNALDLIDMAKTCDVDVVKFQKRNPEKAVPEDQKLKEKIVPWRTEATTYLQYKKDMEFNKDEYDQIDAYCRKKDIKWTASVWDLDSLEFLKQYNLPFIKIPSALITDEVLLQACKDSNIPVYISSGMSSEEEIDRAVELLGNSLKVLFHCNSSYPAKDSELNLSYISVLKNKYPNLKIGYSGHEEGISACIVAGVLEAEVFERHITISRSHWGTDQGASLVFDQIYRLIRDLDKIDIWKGSPVKEIFQSELSIRKKLRGL